MFNRSCPGILAAGYLFFVAGSSAVAQLSISRPMYGVPEFAETGGTFRVEVKADAGLAADQWTAVLLNDLRSWTGIVEEVDYGSYVDNNTVVGYQLKVRVPVDISPEVCSLAIAHTSGGAATNRNAVGIVQNIETNFYILHYADPQAETYEPDNPESGMFGLHGSIREMYWHAPALSLINPRFMFDTGDELDNNYGNSVAHYQEYVDAMCRIGVPVLATRGNNDSGLSTADWRSTIGIETYSVSMGSFSIYMKDYNENYYQDWFTNCYASSFTNASVKYRLLGQHFVVGTTNVFLPSVGQYPGLMLVGHGHSNVTLQTIPCYVLESKQACDKGAVGFFQFERTSTNWVCTTLTNHPDATWLQVMDTGPVARVNSTFSFPNDGTVFSNLATITNGLAFNFWDGRIRFLMKYSATGYNVSNGVKLAEYAYNDNSNMAVVVKVNIGKNTTTEVGVQPGSLDNDEDGMPDAWEVVHFGGTNAVKGGANEDFDGDGLVNEEEYRAGTIPSSQASSLAVSNVVSQAGGKIVLTWSSASNKVYDIIVLTNLMLSATQQIATNLSASPPLNCYTVDVGNADLRFFRIKLNE